MTRLGIVAVGVPLMAVVLAACEGVGQQAGVATSTPATATLKPSPTPNIPTQTPEPNRTPDVPTQVPELSRTPNVPTQTPEPNRTADSPTQLTEPTSTDTPIVPPATTPTPSPPSTGTPGGTSQANGLFDVTVLVDPQGRQVPQDDITRVFSVAASRLVETTGQRMQLVDTVYSLPGGGSPSDLVDAYLRTTAPFAPEGIVVFSEDEQASTYGGYSFFRHLPSPFSNEFRSPRPEVGEDAVYVAVIHFDHFFGRCGYDDNWNHVSDVAIGGECRNQPGTPCVQQGNHWVCADLLDYPYSDHDYFIASNIVHEFMHPFGIDPDPVLDHYATPACVSRTGMTSAQAGDLEQAQLNVVMCPDVFSRFRPGP